MSKCGCGKDAKYLDSGAGGSCNEYKRCPTYEEVVAQLEVATTTLRKYQKAINEIDDYFEHRNESMQDRKKVYQILGNLVDKLKEVVRS